MRNAVLIRPKSGIPDDMGKVGDYVSDSGLHLKMGELAWLWNATGISCTPLGTYRYTWTWSPKHERNCYQAHNVPMRSAIELHPGNLFGRVDLGYATDSEGCQLPGMDIVTFKAGEVVNGHTLTKDQVGVTRSREALAKLEADMVDKYGNSAGTKQVDFDLTILEAT